MSSVPLFTRSRKSKKFHQYVLGLASKINSSVRSLHSDSEEKKEYKKHPGSNLLQSTIAVDQELTKSSVMRLLLPNKLYKLASGGRATVATNGASLLSFTTGPSAQSVRLDTSCVPEITALASLFDDVKVVGITCTYNPFNPYNRGAVVQSGTIAFYWDDDTYGVSPTNSLANMSALSNRGPQYYEISPDHSKSWSFHRMMPVDKIDWGDTTNLGASYPTACAMGVVSDGSLTASSVYGYLVYHLILEFTSRL